ncbi:MAG TPA: SRPBCC family protein, partial [Flavobacteriales bacterium]|nr:SRPBCC family protein [Flavobacteriales bacterium]
KKLKQTVRFNAKPADCYEVIMDPKKHGALTGGKTTMNKKPKGKFMVFDGYVHGYNIELTEGKKIVQAWHFAEDGWPDEHFSICTFEFKKDGTGTKLSFTQEGVPEHNYESLKGGWHTYYWKPMRELFKINETKLS